MSHLITGEAKPDELAELAACCSSGLDCSGGVSPGDELICEKFQELFVALESLAAESGGGRIGCIKEGEGKNAVVTGIVFACKGEDGIRNILLPVAGGEPVDPFTGAFEVCETSQPLKTDCSVLAGPNCGETAWLCPAIGPGFFIINDIGEFVAVNQPVGKLDANVPVPEKSDLLNFEFAGPQVGLTFADLLANALENGGATFGGADGDPINPDDLGTLLHPCGGRFNVLVCDNATCITLNDDTEFKATTAKNAVKHYPEGTTNGTFYHAGSSNVLIGADGDDTYDVAEGAGFYGCIQVQRYVDKGGTVVDPFAEG